MGIRLGEIRQEINVIIWVITFINFNEWKKLVHLKVKVTWN
jgi:hypothetical protein